MSETAIAPPDDASLVEHMLRDNAIGETWRICYLANIFVFPLYMRFEKEHDILRPEFVTLFCLAHHQPLIAQDIVQMTGLPKNTISRGVKRLLDRGLVARGDHPGDRRKARLALTPAGEEMVQRLMPQVVARHEALAGSLNAAERDALGRLLMKMAQFAAQGIAAR